MGETASTVVVVLQQLLAGDRVVLALMLKAKPVSRLVRRSIRDILGMPRKRGPEVRREDETGRAAVEESTDVGDSPGDLIGPRAVPADVDHHRLTGRAVPGIDRRDVDIERRILLRHTRP